MALSVGEWPGADPTTDRARLIRSVVPHELRDRAERHPNRPFLTWKDGPPRTYGDVDRQARRIAAGLAAHGVDRGDTVLLFLPNGLEIILTWFAVNLLGAVEVPVNAHDRGRFLEHILNDSRAEVLVVDAGLVGRVRDVADRLEHLATVIVVGDAAPTPVSGLRTLAFDALLDHGDEVEPAELDHRDVMAVLYTSGTTGAAKGVMMTYGHAALCATHLIDVVELDASDVYFICMPLFHSNAQVIQVMPTLMVGARASVWPEFAASRWLDQVRSVGATVTNTLGVMTEFVFRQPPRSNDADNPLRCVQTIPAPAAIAEAFEQRFAVRCIDGYGLTDVGIVSFRRPDEPLVPGTSGRPLEAFEVVIADPDTDDPVPTGAVGEILVRPRVPFGFMAGYWHAPEATVRAWRNLWFHTGDAGFLDEDGLLHFHDRLKDVIRVRGENVSSSLVESVLYEHPAIAVCAAIAVPSPDGDDDVKVCVVLRPGAALTPEELLDHCAPRMPYFAVPRYVEVYETLPTTPTDKIRKVELRAQGVTASTWDRRAAGYILARD